MTVWKHLEGESDTFKLQRMNAALSVQKKNNVEAYIDKSLGRMISMSLVYT